MLVTVSKNGIPVVKEKLNLCTMMEDSKGNKDAAEIMTMFGVPDECPVAAQEIKTNESQEYSLEKYKQHLMMAEGQILVDCKITHDSVGGRKINILFLVCFDDFFLHFQGESCIKIQMEVKKPGGMLG